MECDFVYEDKGFDESDKENLPIFELLDGDKENSENPKNKEKRHDQNNPYI